MSKGSTVRPSAVSKEEFATNWAAIFSKKEEPKEEPRESYCVSTGYFSKCLSCHNLKNWYDKAKESGLKDLKKIDAIECSKNKGSFYIESLNKF